MREWWSIPALVASLALFAWQQTWSYDTNFIVGLCILLIAILAAPFYPMIVDAYEGQRGARRMSELADMDAYMEVLKVRMAMGEIDYKQAHALMMERLKPSPSTTEVPS